MEVRSSVHPRDVKRYDTEELRRDFLIPNLFIPGEIKMVYSHIDRIIVGGGLPVDNSLSLQASKEIGADYFLERREVGIINIGGRGSITVDEKKYIIEKGDGLYIGLGAEKIYFESENPENPAKYYFNSAPAHKKYPTVKFSIKDIEPENLGSAEESNQRLLFKCIHPEGIKSCQLVMGMTSIKPNNVWNTMPCHTHDRRMEVYFYFDIGDHIVFHLMGVGDQTRHIVVKNEEAVISPSWSIHSGVGTKNYTFIWGMVGENQNFSDMDHIRIKDLK